MLRWGPALFGRKPEMDCEILRSLVWLELFFRRWDKVMKLLLCREGQREKCRVSGTSPELQDETPLLHQHLL